MSFLLGNPGPELRRSLTNVHAGALETGAPATELIVVQGNGDEWLYQLLEQPRQRRLRSVMVARSEVGLAAAVRAGVGGALWSPPATPAMVAALEAAASAVQGASLPTLPLEDAVALVAGSTELWAVVRVADQEMRLGRYGSVALREALAAIGTQLGAAHLLAVGAALLLPAKRVEDALAAWTQRRAEGAPPCRSRLTWCELPAGANEVAILEAAGAARLGDGEGGAREPAILEPVYEIPSGRRVGWWSSRERAEAAPDGWLAVPETGPAGMLHWRLEGSVEGPTTVPEIICSEQVPAVERAAAVRIPGWLLVDLRSATPSGLLVERLARVAEEAGMPLWVPNVSTDGLRFLLGLGTTMWVDGPAVPAGQE